MEIGHVLGGFSSPQSWPTSKIRNDFLADEKIGQLCKCLFTPKTLHLSALAMSFNPIWSPLSGGMLIFVRAFIVVELQSFFSLATKREI